MKKTVLGLSNVIASELIVAMKGFVENFKKKFGEEGSYSSFF